MVTGEDLPLSRRGLQILTEYAQWWAFPSGKETWFWDTLDFLHFVVLVLHYFDAMLPSASFLRKSSKHSKAQILHPMKTIPKPRARRTRSVACNGMRTSAISLLCNCELDTLALWQRDPRLLRTYDEDVVLTRSERVVNGILDVHDVEASIMTLSMGNDTNSSHVATTSNHGNDTSVKLDEVGDLTGCELDLDGVVDLDSWVRVPDTTQAKFRQHF
jgi:hypothetical protein